jgi:hypothetical protein
MVDVTHRTWLFDGDAEAGEVIATIKTVFCLRAIDGAILKFWLRELISSRGQFYFGV